MKVKCKIQRIVILSEENCHSFCALTDESEDEGKEEEEAAPESEPEEEKILTYAEEKELKFSDETSVTISGVRRNPENLDDFDVIDSEWEISGITVEDSEDGKVITVEQRVSGYIWGNDDGSVFKTDISLQERPVLIRKLPILKSP